MPTLFGLITFLLIVHILFCWRPEEASPTNVFVFQLGIVSRETSAYSVILYTQKR